MKTSLAPGLAVLFFCAMLITWSCHKSDSGSTSTQTADEGSAITLATTATCSELLYDDAFGVVLQSGEQSNINVAGDEKPALGNAQSYSTAIAYNSTSCAVITLSPQDTATFPKTMTIDYGSGCTATDGVTRKGKLIVALSGKIRAGGSTISITFSGYSVNGYALTGTYALTSNTATGGGVNYTVSVTSGGITYPDGKAYTYSGSETFIQTAGTGTTTVTDDSYAITGSFNSSGPGGSISGTITAPLVISYGCKDVTSGTVSFTYKGINAVLDFGSGACDNQATITAGPATKIITLPK